MKLLVTIILTLISLGIMHSQLSAYYDFQISNEYLDCSIAFSQKGNYSIELSAQETDDIISTLVLSQGLYSIKNKEIILKDENNGFMIRLHNNPVKKSITVDQGFIFLKDKASIGMRKGIEPSFIKTRIDSLSQKKERDVYLQSHRTSYPIYYGIYEGENNYQLNRKGEWEGGHGYELNIQKNCQYTLYYKRMLILQGAWKRNGNELALYDESLQHTFYVLIGNEKLISRYLPGDYYGTELKPYRMLGR